MVKYITRKQLAKQAFLTDLPIEEYVRRFRIEYPEIEILGDNEECIE